MRPFISSHQAIATPGTLTRAVPTNMHRVLPSRRMPGHQTDAGFLHVVGYGLAIIAGPGTELAQAEAQPDTLIMRHAGRAEPAVLAAAVLHRRLTESPRLQIDDHVEVQSCQSPSTWVLRTAEYRCIWPRGLDVHARGGSGQPCVFDLVAPGGVLVWIQGPIDRRQIPEDEAFVGKGQRLQGNGRAGRARWVELGWDEDKTSWIQRHYVMPLIARTALIVTMEAPTQKAERFIVAAEEVLRSLELPEVAPA
jgi:hypothetical protein